MDNTLREDQPTLELSLAEHTTNLRLQDAPEPDSNDTSPRLTCAQLVSRERQTRKAEHALCPDRKTTKEVRGRQEHPVEIYWDDNMERKIVWNDEVAKVLSETCPYSLLGKKCNKLMCPYLHICRFWNPKTPKATPCIFNGLKHADHTKRNRGEPADSIEREVVHIFPTCKHAVKGQCTKSAGRCSRGHGYLEIRKDRYHTMRRNEGLIQDALRKKQSHYILFEPSPYE